MHSFRYHIKRTSVLWLAFLLPVLLLMLSMSLHVHRHLNHHDEALAQHHHPAALHDTHLGNTHDKQQALTPEHTEPGVLAIDIPAKGLAKSFALMLLACAFILLLVLLPPRTAVLLLPRLERGARVIRWCSALSPLRRGPPLPAC